MRRIGRGGLQRQADRLGDLVIADLPRRAGARLIIKPLDAALGKTSAPFADRILIGADGSRDQLVFYTSGGREYDPCPARHTLGRPSTARQSLQFGALGRTQLDRNRRLSHGYGSPISQNMII
jgi:hypothetical protein